MREFIIPADKANEIRMRRSIYSGAFLLVEGDSDAVFYRQFINRGKCSIEVAVGKQRVIEILQDLDKNGFQGALGVVDADFDHLEDEKERGGNLLLTDAHDLEVMILAAGGFEKLLNEYASDKKLPKFIEEHGDVKEVVLAAGMQLGYLRWISQINGLNLKFTSIVFSHFLSQKSLKLNKLDLIKEVKNKSNAQSLKSDDLDRQILAQQDDQHDPWQVCCGHDLMEILALGFVSAIGTSKAKVTIDALERNLRLSYEASWFPQTNLYLEIQAWENRNQPFLVLSRAVSDGAL